MFPGSAAFSAAEKRDYAVQRATRQPLRFRRLALQTSHIVSRCLLRCVARDRTIAKLPRRRKGF